MIFRRFIKPSFGVIQYAFGVKPFSRNTKPHNIMNRQQIEAQLQTKKQKTMKVYEDQSDIQLAEYITRLNLKDFSIKIHHLLVQKQKSPLFWSTVENQFLNRIVPTTDPVTIRSYSKILYSLSKSKKALANYETQIGLVLPFATNQSFVQMITSISRIAPYSQQFGYIVQKLYYKRKNQFNPREIIAINYSLANNGRKCDEGIIEYIDHYNAVQTITMLRCYDKSEMITEKILKESSLKLKSIVRQFNVLDLADLINIYLKYEYVNEQLETLIQNSYTILKRHVNDICLEKIWMYLPKNMNKGRMKIKFVQEIITTIQILRKSKNMSEVIWKKIQPTFKDIINIQLKLRLQKIY